MVNRHYQKPLITFISLLLGFILLTLMAGCGSKRPLTSSVTEIKEHSKERNDSIVVIDHSKAIADALNLYLGQIKTGAGENCDSLCQLEIDRILKNLQTEKQSGDNSYRLVYDENQKLLKLMMQMAATSNKNVTVDKDMQTDTSNKQVTEIPVAYVPDFWRWSAYFGWAAAAYLAIRAYDKVKAWTTKKFSL